MATAASGAQIEQLTRRIGLEIFERVEAHRPTVFESLWWEEKLLGVLMSEPRLKLQAFRFIDVLPTLGSPRELARHLREYFTDPRLARRAPRTIAGHNGQLSPEHLAEEQRAALTELGGRSSGGLSQWLSRTLDFDDLDSPKARFFAWAARAAAVMMARRFIAGTTVVEAERTLRRLREQRLAFSVDVLGEAAVSSSESEHYQQLYLELITKLPPRAARWEFVPVADTADGVGIPRVNVSVKLTSLFSGFDAIDPAGTKRAVQERLRPLLRRGMECGAHIHIDLEHYAIKDLTLEIFRETMMEAEFHDYPHFGIVLQAYLRDGDRDAADMIDFARSRGTPIWIRLVKGAYWDSETIWSAQNHWPCPVWKQKWQSDACYERMTRTLLAANEHIHTAFGTHNIRSMAHALALKEAWNISPASFEIQMLYGMGDPIKRALVAMNERCRIYTPYGQLLPGMAYFIRRLLENTANESFLRHTFDPDTPKTSLLRDPAEAGRSTPPPEPPPLIRYEFEEPLMDPFDNAPNTDFGHEANRRKMLDALKHIRSDFGRRYPLIIGGQRVTTDSWKESVNPGRPAEVIGVIAQADASAATRAIEAAASALASWRRVAPQERAACLARMAAILEARRYEFAALMCLECGKPWREADADLSEAVDFCAYYAKEMVRMAENARRRDIPGETNEYFYAPRGVVAVISPWNFPLAILTGMATAAIVTGNTVVMKPAAPASVVAVRLMEVFEEAGLPPGVANYLPGPGSIVGEILVEHPSVAMIAFTGSREVGCRINRAAAETVTRQPALKKVIAEMGGKNAVIVDSDADLDEALKGVVHSAFGYAGQKCSAASRCIVLDAVYDRFVDRLVEASRSVQVGPADDPGTFVPPVIDKNAYDAIRRYIDIGKAESRCLLAADVSKLVAETGGYFVGPTIFGDVSPSSRLAREEVFGPVLAVIRAADIDAAISIFNGTDFALTGGIYSRSPAHIERARRECECGNLYINRKITGALVDVQPFGGFKMSGIGSKAGGPDYLIQFCEPRTVTENTLRRGFAPAEELAATV